MPVALAKRRMNERSGEPDNAGHKLSHKPFSEANFTREIFKLSALEVKRGRTGRRP